MGVVSNVIVQGVISFVILGSLKRAGVIRWGSTKGRTIWVAPDAASCIDHTTRVPSVIVKASKRRGSSRARAYQPPLPAAQALGLIGIPISLRSLWPQGGCTGD